MMSTALFEQESSALVRKMKTASTIVDNEVRQPLERKLYVQYCQLWHDYMKTRGVA